MKSSTQLSKSHDMAIAMMTNPALRTVRHASPLSKYHLRPSSRAALRSASTPVTKSIAMKSTAQQTSGRTGANIDARPSAAALIYLNKASIYRTFFHCVIFRTVLRIILLVCGEMVRQPAQQRAAASHERALQFVARAFQRRVGPSARRYRQSDLPRADVERALHECAHRHGERGCDVILRQCRVTTLGEGFGERSAYDGFDVAVHCGGDVGLADRGRRNVLAVGEGRARPPAMV